MKLKYLMFVAAALLGGCVERVNGPELSEPGEVYDTCFVPQGHGSGSSVGFTSDGALTSSSTSIEVPARYAIVFRCQHGKFVIDGDRGKVLYNKLSKGDHVTIRYCEVLEVKDGVTTPVELHFIDAHITKESNAKGTEALEAR